MRQRKHAILKEQGKSIMSMNLIHTNRNVDQDARAKADWAAITAISAADPSSPYPTEGYVAVSAETVITMVALLDGVELSNGEHIAAYNFSVYDDDGRDHLEAHVNSFGPSLLKQRQVDAMRAILAPFPPAIAMLDEVIARGIQLALSTETPGGDQVAHLKAVNWPADEVEINRCSGNMVAMLRDLGLVVPDAEAGETDFATFAAAVNDNAARTDYPADRLRAFVACGQRQGATHVYWA